MKRFIFAIIIAIGILSACNDAYGQTCPENMVCLPPETAREALKAVDERNALRDENKVLKESNAAKDRANNDLVTELKIKTQEIIDLKANAVVDREMIRFLLQRTRKKCLPFSVCIN